MKRVLLRSIKDIRRAAVAIAEHLAGGDAGRRPPDPLHEFVTEGRRTQWERAHAAGAAWAQHTPYSSCGDLAHALLWCLGCRDEHLVNRDSDGGDTPWKSQINISRLVASPAYRAYDGGIPELGDIVHVASPDHVAVLTARGDVWRTADYGQPYGCCHVSRPGFSGRITLRGRRLLGWIDLSRVVLVESAIVPDSCGVGEVDDSPYPEVGVTLPGG